MDLQHCMDDLPHALAEDVVAIDTETMGLRTRRDRLCLVQVGLADGRVYLVQIRKEPAPAPHLCALIQNPKVVKLFHFARFDMAALYHRWGMMPRPVYCTKIASKLARTYTDRHGLKELCRELLSTEISKGEQSSDWGREKLTEEQKRYAAKDVLYLHRLKERFSVLLKREGRDHLLSGCLEFLPTRVQLDLLGWEEDILQH